MKCMGCPNLSISDYAQMKQNYEKLKDYVKVLEENIKLEREINKRFSELLSKDSEFKIQGRRSRP